MHISTAKLKKISLLSAGILGIFAIVLIAGWNNTISFLAEEPVQEENVLTQTISDGATFGILAERAQVPPHQLASLLETSKSVYDLSTVVSGRELLYTFGKNGDLDRLKYKINSSDQFIAERRTANIALDEAAMPENDYVWDVRIEKIPYTITYDTVSGIIDSSLYETIVGAGGDERLAIALSEIFAWQVDFAVDIQTGDSFKAYYEKRYLNGQYVMPGRILVARFINSGEAYDAYYFRGQQTKAGYYDESGEALQKVFLKAPLQYKYISSGYTVSRITPILNRVMPHRAIDYAAPYGTPAVSVGDGAIVQAGWKRYYGNSVTVRHNETYQTVYGHFQSIARGVRTGARVSQGQILGYVGSTGLSTGPHLHYEMRKYGTHVNPYRIEVPPGEPIADADRDLFSVTLAHLRSLSQF